MYKLVNVLFYSSLLLIACLLIPTSGHAATSGASSFECQFWWFNDQTGEWEGQGNTSSIFYPNEICFGSCSHCREQKTCVFDNDNPLRQTCKCRKSQPETPPPVETTETTSSSYPDEFGDEPIQDDGVCD